MTLPDMIGIIGVMITLAAYFLLNIEKISSKSFAYPGLNAIGSFLILYSLYYDWNLAAFIMECCWLLISFYGVYEASRAK